MSLQLAAKAERERRRRRQPIDRNRVAHPASGSLMSFCRFVDPTYIAAKHIVYLAGVLTRVERYVETNGAEGIGRLIVNLPPRHGKSLTISKRWPSYILGRHPFWRISLISYQSDIAEDVSRANKSLIRDSLEYRQIWPDIRLNPSSSALERWSLSIRPADDPSVVATGVGGPLTGRGFDIILIDDPIKSRAEAESPAYRHKMIEWYKGTLRPRLEPGGAIVIVCTRWHEADLAGYLIDSARKEDGNAENWENINLPALALAGDPLGRAEGEALWPGRYSREALLKIKDTVNDYDWSSQYQGLPVAPGGAVFLREWYAAGGMGRFDLSDRRWTSACVGRWLSFDTAFEDDEQNDFTAVTVGELSRDYRLGIVQVDKRRLTFPDLLSYITGFAKTHNRDGKLRGIIIEDKGSGKSAIHTLTALVGRDEWIAGLVIPYDPGRASKTERARRASVWCKNGSVLLPLPSEKAEWLFDFESDLFSFPSSINDDTVDSFSQLVIFLENLLAEGLKARGG